MASISRTAGLMLLGALLFLLPHAARAQQFAWARGLGYWTDDNVVGTATDKQGNVYVTGFALGGAKIGTYVMPTWGMYLAKYAPDGALVWVRQSDGNFDTQSATVRTDSQDNVYVAGWYVHAITLGPYVLPGAAQPRMFIVKYDAQGNLQWARHFGTRSAIQKTFASDMVLDQSDQLYVAGSFTGIIDWDGFTLDLSPGSHHTFDNSDIYLLKLTPAGKVTWVRSAGGRFNDTGLSLALDSAANAIYLSGLVDPRNARFGDIAYEQSSTEPIPFVARYDYAGNVEWVTGITGWGARLIDLVADHKGGFYASGTMYVGDYRFGERLVKAVDYGREVNSFVARYNGQGVLTWLKQFPLTGSGFEYFPTHTPITADRDGNIYLAAPFTQTVRIDTFVLNYVPALEPNRYYNDVLVARFNAVGQAQWVKKIGGANRERPSAIALDPQQHVIVAGQYTTATLSFDGHVITNNSGNDDEDVFVAKLSNPGPVVCLPTTVAIEAPPAFCEGDSVRITAKTTRAYSFLWLRDREVVEAAYDSTLFTKAGGVFQLVINPFTACADTSAAIAVNRIEKPGTTLTLSADSVLCPGEQLTLSAPVHQTYTYQWYKDGQALPGQTRPTLRAGEAGAYYVQIANQNQCPQNSGVQRVVTVPRQEDFLPDTVYRCIDQPEKLTPTLNDFRGTFRWSTGETSESITPPAPGSYVLRLTQHDCVYTDSVRIVEVPALFVPNVITPNADGKNDFFFIRNLLPGTALEIYNRFGTLVYRKAEYQNDWDGGEVPAGVYFYLLRSAHSCARPKVAKGWVQVLR